MFTAYFSLFYLHVVHIMFFFITPHSGEKLLFPSRHHLQLAPVALHSDAGKHLAGLDILLACSWMSYVSEPTEVIPFCMSFSAKSELLG